MSEHLVEVRGIVRLQTAVEQLTLKPAKTYVRSLTRFLKFRLGKSLFFRYKLECIGVYTTNYARRSENAIVYEATK